MLHSQSTRHYWIQKVNQRPAYWARPFPSKPPKLGLPPLWFALFSNFLLCFILLFAYLFYCFKLTNNFVYKKNIIYKNIKNPENTKTIIFYYNYFHK